MITERYTRLSDLPTSLPVFPLRGIILLPRTALPFNIFEPRYLEMIDDVLAGNRLIGMIQPGPRPMLSTDMVSGISIEEEKVESPIDRSWPLRGSGCVGRLTGFEEQDNGRMAITITGIARFKLVDETDHSKPYRVCNIDCQPFAKDLDQEEDEEQQVDREKLLTLLRLYLNANDMTADWRSIHRSSTGYLVNTLCIHSPYGPEEKQALLEAGDLKTRAEILMALAEMELASKNEGGGTLQ